MPFTVYDYRNPDHIRNLLVTPEMRSRILKMEPGQGFNARHSHDLGHEVFVVLQGSAEFEIDGEEIGRALPAAHGIVADAREAAVALEEGLTGVQAAFPETDLRFFTTHSVCETRLPMEFIKQRALGAAH